MATRGTESSRASGDRGQQVGGTRSGRGQAHGGLAGDAGHALGDEPRALFMAREDMTDGAAVAARRRTAGWPRRGMPAMVRMPCRSSKVRRRLAPVIFHGGSRCEPAPLARSGGGQKKKPPPVRHRRGQSLINDQNPRGARPSATTTTTTTTRARPRDRSVV